MNSSVFDADPWLPNMTVDVDQRHTMEQILMSYVTPATLIVVAVFGFIGNLSVVIVIAANAQMRNSTSYLLIATLAVVDLIFVAMCLPFGAFTYISDNWPFGSAWCKVYYHSL